MSLSVTSDLKVIDDGKLIGMGDITMKDFRRHINTMSYKTFCLVYSDIDVEEIDILALPGRELEVAEVVANRKFMKGFRLEESDKYFANRFRKGTII